MGPLPAPPPPPPPTVARSQRPGPRPALKDLGSSAWPRAGDLELEGSPTRSCSIHTARRRTSLQCRTGAVVLGHLLLLVGLQVPHLDQAVAAPCTSPGAVQAVCQTCSAGALQMKGTGRLLPQKWAARSAALPEQSTCDMHAACGRFHSGVQTGEDGGTVRRPGRAQHWLLGG